MYLFEKLVYFLDIALFTLVSDITPETLFWAHNAIVLVQFIGRICFFVFIIKTPNSNENLNHQTTPSEPKFYVRAPQFLEPRRPNPIFLENLLSKCEERTAKAIYRRKCSSRSKYIVHGDPGATNMSSGLTLVEIPWSLIPRNHYSNLIAITKLDGYTLSDTILICAHHKATFWSARVSESFLSLGTIKSARPEQIIYHVLSLTVSWTNIHFRLSTSWQGSTFRLMFSHLELTQDHVLHSSVNSSGLLYIIKVVTSKVQGGIIR